MDKPMRDRDINSRVDYLAPDTIRTRLIGIGKYGRHVTQRVFRADASVPTLIHLQYAASQFDRIVATVSLSRHLLISWALDVHVERYIGYGEAVASCVTVDIGHL